MSTVRTYYTKASGLGAQSLVVSTELWESVSNRSFASSVRTVVKGDYKYCKT